MGRLDNDGDTEGDAVCELVTGERLPIGECDGDALNDIREGEEAADGVPVTVWDVDAVSVTVAVTVFAVRVPEGDEEREGVRLSVGNALGRSWGGTGVNAKPDSPET